MFVLSGQTQSLQRNDRCVRVQWMLLSGCLEEVWGREKCHFSHSAECDRAGLSAYLFIRVSFEQRQHNLDITFLRIASQRWRNIIPIELGVYNLLHTANNQGFDYCSFVEDLIFWIWQHLCDVVFYVFLFQRDMKAAGCMWICQSIGTSVIWTGQPSTIVRYLPLRSK